MLETLQLPPVDRKSSIFPSLLFAPSLRPQGHRGARAACALLQAGKCQTDARELLRQPGCQVCLFRCCCLLFAACCLLLASLTIAIRFFDMSFTLTSIVSQLRALVAEKDNKVLLDAIKQWGAPESLKHLQEAVFNCVSGRMEQVWDAIFKDCSTKVAKDISSQEKKDGKAKSGVGGLSLVCLPLFVLAMRILCVTASLLHSKVYGEVLFSSFAFAVARSFSMQSGARYWWLCGGAHVAHTSSFRRGVLRCWLGLWPRRFCSARSPRL
jgi:hypothetical protein